MAQQPDGVYFNPNSYMHEVWIDGELVGRSERRNVAHTLFIDMTIKYPDITEKGVIQNETSSTTESTAHEGS